jgi:hypothetical protein
MISLRESGEGCVDFFLHEPATLSGKARTEIRRARVIAVIDSCSDCKVPISAYK